VEGEEYDINEEEDMYHEDDNEFFNTGWVILSQGNVVWTYYIQEIILINQFKNCYYAIYFLNIWRLSQMKQ
jgi:hypothetical protein